MADLIKQKAEKTITNLEVDKVEKKITPESCAQLKKPHMDELRVAFGLYDHALLIDSSDYRSENGKYLNIIYTPFYFDDGTLTSLELIDKAQEQEQTSIRSNFSQSTRPRGYTVRMASVVHKDFEERIFGTDSFMSISSTNLQQLQ